MARAASGPDKKKPKKAPAPPGTAKKQAAAAAPMGKRKMAVPKPVAKSAPAKKAAPKKAAAKKAAPKMAPAPKKPGPKKAPAKKAPAKSAAPKKAAPPKKSAPKTAARSAPAKTVAVKHAAPRRIPAKAPPPATRRARSVPAAKRPRPTAAAPRPAATARPPQAFTVSHLNEADFKADGLRPYALYRDLGIAAATSGLCQAHVIRFVPPTTDEVRKRHMHSVDLQLVYVLKGWIKNEFEGYGEQMMSAGSCWLQPSGIEHTVLEYSPDCEVLEIIVPADFTTEEVS
jgi:hypothetical protein